MSRWTQTLIPGTSDEERGLVHAVPADVLRAAERAAERLKKPGSDNTTVVYRRAKARYEAWCIRAHLSPWPLDPLQLITYLEHLSATVVHRVKGDITTAPSTVRQQMSALCSQDRWHRAEHEKDPLSVATHPAVQRWLRDWASDHPEASSKQAPALTVSALRTIVEGLEVRTKSAAYAPWEARVARDRAMWLVGIGGALRLQDMRDLLFQDVKITSRGLSIRLRYQKGDQTGKGQVRGIMHSGTLSLCPVLAWERWVKARGEWSGPAFVSIQKNGELGGAQLHWTTLDEILRRGAERAGIQVTSHTMRRTFATLARRKRARPDAIMRQGGWKSQDTMNRYFELEDIWDDNATAGLFDGE